jgi:hypothetical protein
MEVTLASGVSAEITASFTIPNVIEAVETTVITATSSLDSAASATVTDSVVVGSPAAGVSLSPGQQIDVEPGTTQIITHSITNTGTWTDTYTITFESSRGWTTGAPVTVVLAAGQVGVLTVEIIVPDMATGTEVVTITAISALDPDVSATVVDSAEVVLPDTSSTLFLPIIRR